MRVIGLTGGIASGKSTVAKYLAELGLAVIDADKLGHQVYLPNTNGFAKVVDAFGSEIVGDDGHIDRRKLGAIVFGDSDALDRLTSIAWPEIKKLAREEIEKSRKESPDRNVVLEAAVLIEAQWQDIVDEIWVVVVDRETAISRACQRDGVTPDAVEARIDAQLSNAERIAQSDVSIRNDQNKETLLSTVDKALEQTKQRAIS